MYEISQEAHELYRASYRDQVDVQLIISDDIASYLGWFGGATSAWKYFSTGAGNKGRIVDMTLKETLGAGDDDNIPIGHISSAELTVTVAGCTKEFAASLAGHTCYPYAAIASDVEKTIVPLGVFTICDIDSQDDFQTVELTCRDALARATDIPFDSMLIYPIDIASVVSECCSLLGISTGGLAGLSGYTIEEEPIGYSCWQILEFIAALNNQCLRLNRETGVLEAVVPAVVYDSNLAPVYDYQLEPQQVLNGTHVKFPEGFSVVGAEFTAGDKVYSFAPGSDEYVEEFDASIDGDGSLMVVIYGDAETGYTAKVMGAGDMKAAGTNSPWLSKYRNTLVAVEVDEGITSLSNYAFLGCGSLKRVELSSTVKSLGENCFSSSRIKEIDLQHVETIGTSAFQSCITMLEVDFGDSLTTIGTNAFNDCRVLGKRSGIYLPKTVATIGFAAFKSCPAKVIELKAIPASIGNYAFQTGQTYTVVRLPGSASDYSGAPWACTGTVEFTGVSYYG